MSETQDVVVVTAQFLETGNPAYLRADGTWTRSLREAAVLPAEKGDVEASTRRIHEQRLVADPYTFPVKLLEGGGIDESALSTRERVRSTGPTVRIRRPD